MSATRPTPDNAARPLAGRHALITGASGGLGRACALALARRGARVSLLARGRDALDVAAAELRAEGHVADVLVADVNDEQAIEEAVERAERAAPIDVLINAAGINRPQPTADMPVADWDAIIGANLRGAFLACRAVGRRMLAAGRGGRIVNLSSQMGSVGYPGRAAYCASKHAVNGLTKALAVEWGPHGITVNAVAPTFIEGEWTARMMEDKTFAADVRARIPIGRLGRPEEVAAAVAYLVSPDAELVNGHVLLVDGGWVAW